MERAVNNESITELKQKVKHISFKITKLENQGNHESIVELRKIVDIINKTQSKAYINLTQRLNSIDEFIARNFKPSPKFKLGSRLYYIDENYHQIRRGIIVYFIENRDDVIPYDWFYTYDIMQDNGKIDKRVPENLISENYLPLFVSENRLRDVTLEWSKKKTVFLKRLFNTFPFLIGLIIKHYQK